MGYFYWLASSASKLEGRSKEFCIRVKYFWLGDDTICGVVVTSINGSNYQSDDTRDLTGFIPLDPITIGSSVMDLNLRLFLSMIAAITTYLVIIVQFQAGEGTN
ncbi:putative gustatory receptor 23a, isoform B [Folsomia candida]|uniref:Putative gustatory receptor 23a, isoform B n=1 Tax=Folsomia candida TaxID=158441 RepID=A0A226E985_FOLCA|nr:putative gustatory receptor 23a, isoform B [Folsomia candida]